MHVRNEAQLLNFFFSNKKSSLFSCNFIDKFSWNVELDVANYLSYITHKKLSREKTRIIIKCKKKWIVASYFT